MKIIIKNLRSSMLMGILIMAQVAYFCDVSAQQGKQSRQLTQPENNPTEKSSEKRVALVIGNANYKIKPLTNPGNDAEEMSKTLKSLGFDVVEGKDLTLNEMKQKITEFGGKLANSKGVGLFYYAGHGVQVNGINYLIPIDLSSLRENSIKYEALDAGLVIAEMLDDNRGVNIVILDACRSNPFEQTKQGASVGLALIHPPAAGMLIAYATLPNKVADDGTGRNGLFTSELLKQIVTPGLDVEEVFRKVREQVEAITHGAQVPSLETTVTGRFYFNQPGDKTKGNVSIVKNEDSLDTAAKLQTPSGRTSDETTLPGYLHASRGDRFMKERRWVKAETEYHVAVQMAPGRAEWHGRLGKAMKAQGKFEDAKTEFLKAVGLEPDNAEWHSNTGDVLYWQEKYQEAETEHRTAVQLEPSNGYRHTLLGAVLKTEGRQAESDAELQVAVRLLEEVTRHESNKAEPWSKLGDALLWQDRYADAEGNYRQASRLEPNNAEYRSSLAIVRMKQNKWAEAEAEIRKAVQRDPMNASYHYYLGTTLCSLNKCAEAVSEYREAVRLESSRFEFRFGLGCLLYRQSNYADAQRELKDAIRLKPNNAAAHNLLGNILSAQQNYIEAETVYRRAIELQPNDGLMQSNLGDALLELEGFEEAEDAFRKAVGLKPDDASFHSKLGDALRQQNKYEEAEIECRKAIQLEPNNADYLNLLALVFYDQESFEEAETLFRDALKADPNKPYIHYNLGNSLWNQEKWEEAGVAFKKALELDPENAEYQESVQQVDDVNPRKRKNRRTFIRVR
jgi:tetratricopeptide (TPR) repeat protein